MKKFFMTWQFLSAHIIAKVNLSCYSTPIFLVLFLHIVFLTFNTSITRIKFMDTDILEKFPDQKPVRVFLPIEDEKERTRVQAVFKRGEEGRFRLLFAPGELPEHIDVMREAIIGVDLGGPSLSIEAKIRGVDDNEQGLDMVLIHSVSHEQSREFFRVDATTHIVSRPFAGSDDEQWELSGESIDISGSGVLAVFDREVPEAKFISLQLTLPTEDEKTGKNDVVEVVAHQVRSQRRDDGRYQVAFHYDDVSEEDRDKIIGSCFILQRKMLRLRVRVKED